MVRHDDLRVDWLGYATIRVETPVGVVYFDPGRYGVLDGRRPRDGDVVCITHNHHYDPEGVERVAAPDAAVVSYEGVDAGSISRDVRPVDDLDYETRRVGEDESFVAGGLPFRTVPAYNDPDGPHTDDGRPHHPRGFGVGYLLEVAGGVFWPGDTDPVPEHDGLDVSLFLPPIGGTYTMDRHEAADLAARLDPDLVLPVHYDTFPEIETESDAFAADVAGRGIPVVLDEG